MDNNTEASTSSMPADDERESQDIAPYLPPRLREIRCNSEARDRFYLLNNDMISDRILPAMDRHLRHHILTDCPGPVAQVFRNSLPNAPEWPRSDIPHPALLFSIYGYRHDGIIPPIIEFYDCALRDKRLVPLPKQIRERSALLPEIMFATSLDELQWPFLQAVGHKVVYWIKYDPNRPFTYIMTADDNVDWTFRTLDTSIICREIEAQDPGRALLTTFAVQTIVGERLIVLLLFENSPVPLQMLVLDVNTERWSLLPQCPVDLGPFPAMTPFSWKGKLHFTDLVTQIIKPMHFDFEMNMWVVEDDDVRLSLTSRSAALPERSAALPERSVGLPLRYFVCSRSGTLYCIIADLERPVSDRIHVYSMDDVRSGWNRVHLRKSVHTQQHDPFACYPTEDGGLGTIKCWEVNEHDILLVIFRCYRLKRMKYSWWILNQHDGIKSYGWEEFHVRGIPVFDGFRACMKIES